MAQIDRPTLEAALVGYQATITELNGRVAAIRKELGVRGGGGDIPTPSQKPARQKRRKMSAAGRRRIAAAQRKRWAEYNKAKGL